MSALFTLATGTAYQIIGIRKIARVCGVDPSTLRLWIRRHNFPAWPLPLTDKHGTARQRYATTYSCIDAWGVARWRASLATALEDLTPTVSPSPEE